MELKGYQRSYLAKLAHDLKPVVFLGKAGATPAVLKEIEDALEREELIKIRFVANKEDKRYICRKITETLGAYEVSVIGNVAILYRQASEPDNRHITIPSR
ncbi:YhbY family RNA-binding protein [Spirochaetia bacterium 38H-sp]|uniref:YhbY family RNA-binding protein n=1 Tax=Rarispira pelagica TaxID=3141764 RepID=A0ABU9UBH6_9SPIR